MKQTFANVVQILVIRPEELCPPSQCVFETPLGRMSLSAFSVLKLCNTRPSETHARSLDAINAWMTQPPAPHQWLQLVSGLGSLMMFVWSVLFGYVNR